MEWGVGALVSGTIGPPQSQACRDADKRAGEEHSHLTAPSTTPTLSHLCPLLTHPGRSFLLFWVFFF